MLNLSNRITRFCKYSSVGVSTFLFDLVLLYALVEFFQVQYLIATGAAFIIAITINYSLSRCFVFSETVRPIRSGYIIFLLIAGMGLVWVTGLMYLFVGVFGAPLLISRVIVAGIVGMWNYLMNLYLNFKVAGSKDKKEGLV